LFYGKIFVKVIYGTHFGELLFTPHYSILCILRLEKSIRKFNQESAEMCRGIAFRKLLEKGCESIILSS
jgi:hypothetical protein